MDHRHITTTNKIIGYHITEHLGIARGVTVRARGIVGQLAAGLRTIAGGKIHEYVTLCEETRQEAYDLMVRHAETLGANAIIGMRYDATELAENMTEVLAYGTAVVIEPGPE